MQLYALDMLGAGAGEALTDKREVLIVVVSSEHITGMAARTFEVAPRNATITEVQQVYSEACTCPVSIDEAPCREPTYYHVRLSFDHDFLGSISVHIPASKVSGKYGEPNSASAPILLTRRSNLPVSVLATYKIA